MSNKLVTQVFNNVIQEKERLTTFWRRRVSNLDTTFHGRNDEELS